MPFFYVVQTKRLALKSFKVLVIICSMFVQFNSDESLVFPLYNYVMSWCFIKLQCTLLLGCLLMQVSQQWENVGFHLFGFEPMLLREIRNSASDNSQRCLRLLHEAKMQELASTFGQLAACMSEFSILRGRTDLVLVSEDLQWSISHVKAYLLVWYTWWTESLIEGGYEALIKTDEAGNTVRHDKKRHSCKCH